MTQVPGSGQSPRGNHRPVETEEPASSAGSPSEHDAASSMRDIDAALTTLRVGERASDDAGNQWLERLDLRSPDPRVCPFLRALDDSDQLAVPIGAPDALNRCAALREAIPQSLRQQELVCLTSGHVNCPRYLRGAMAAEAAPRRAALTLSAVRRPAIPRPSVSPAIFAATLVLIAAFAGSVAFVVARGGLAMPVVAVERPDPSPSALAVAPTPEPSPSPTHRERRTRHPRRARHPALRPPRAPRRARRRRRRPRRHRSPSRRGTRSSPASPSSGAARAARTATSISSNRATTCSALRVTTACRTTASCG